MRSTEEAVGSITDGGGLAVVRRRAGLGARHDILDRIIDGTLGLARGSGSIGTALEVRDKLPHHARGARGGTKILLNAGALAHDTMLTIAHLGRGTLIGTGSALCAEEKILDVVLDRGAGG